MKYIKNKNLRHLQNVRDSYFKLVDLFERILCVLKNCIKSNSSFCVFFVTFDVGKHRIAAFCAGKCIKVNFTTLVLSILVQWEKCNVFFCIYRENSKDRAFYLGIIFHGKCDSFVFFRCATSTAGITSAAAGSAVTWVTSAKCKFVTHFIFLILSFLSVRGEISAASISFYCSRNTVRMQAAVLSNYTTI